MWDTSEPWGQERLVQSNLSLVWVDTFGLGSEGEVWATSRGWPLDSEPRVVRLVRDSGRKEKCAAFCQALLA